MKFKLSKYIVLLFSLLKYIEIILTSLTTFSGRKIRTNSTRYGSAYLLYITYTNYLALGLNQVVTKIIAVSNRIKKVGFITINFQYIILSSVINVLLAFVFIGKTYGFNCCIRFNINNFLEVSFSAYYRGGR